MTASEKDAYAARTQAESQTKAYRQDLDRGKMSVSRFLCGPAISEPTPKKG